MQAPPQHEEQVVQFERADHEQPQLKWIVVEDPSHSFLLKEDDYILDSYFNPQYDVWEVLVRLDNSEEEEEED